MYHLLIPAVTAIAYAAGLVALSYSTVKNWIRQKAVSDGYVDLIKQHLDNGNYTVIAGAFSPTGTAVARRTWTNVRIADSLSSQFGGANAIRIET